MDKRRVIDAIIETEGGYINDLSDSGGETKFGITVATARAAGYSGEMRLLPRRVAFDIYSARYWDAVKADDLSEQSPATAFEVVDTGVNCGVDRAATFLQRCLNVFNNRGRFYPDIAVDGDIGPATLDALRSFLLMRDESVLVSALNCLQGAFYIELAERREKDERYVYGWLKNRVKL